MTSPKKSRRGGKRPGAGRPKLPESAKLPRRPVISFRAPTAADYDELERMAKAADKTISVYAKDLIFPPQNKSTEHD